MRTSDEVIAKLQKVLALANGLNATEGEMAAAMGKAKEIAMRYNIDLSTIKPSNGEAKPTMDVRQDTALKTSSENMRPHHTYIFGIFDKVFGVRTVLSRCGARIHTIYLIGETVDIEICKVLFPWLERAFTRAYSKALSDGRFPDTAANKNGHHLGFYYGVLEANRQEEAKLTAQDKSAYALVVRNKDALVVRKMEELHPNMKEAKNRKMKISWQAEQLGRIEGRKIQLRQVGSGKSAQQLT